MTGVQVAALPNAGKGLARAGISRLAEYLLTLLLLVVLNFAAVHALPGDPLAILFGNSLTRGLDEASRATLLASYGLDGTLPDQFLRYAKHLARGDLGFSARHAAPVLDMIVSVLPWTLALVSASALLAFSLGMAIGVEAAMHRRRRGNRWFFVVVAVVDSVPPFAKAILVLTVFSVGLDLLPASGGVTPFSQDSGWENAGDIVLHALAPVGTLAMHEAAKMAFFTRASAMAVLSRPFMMVARAKGVSPWRLRGAYLARNTLAVVVARTAGMLTGLMAGAVFVETVFSYPGIGHLIFDGIYSRDYPLVQGVLLFMGVVILTVNLAADLTVLRLAARG